MRKTKKPPYKYKKCPECSGSGKEWIRPTHWPVIGHYSGKECPYCNGTGKIPFWIEKLQRWSDPWLSKNDLKESPKSS